MFGGSGGPTRVTGRPPAGTVPACAKSARESTYRSPEGAEAPSRSEETHPSRETRQR